MRDKHRSAFAFLFHMLVYWWSLRSKIVRMALIIPPKVITYMQFYSRNYDPTPLSWEQIISECRSSTVWQGLIVWCSTTHTQYGGKIREKLVLTYKTHAINVEAHCLNVRVNLLAELWLQELPSVIGASNLTGCETLYLTKFFSNDLRNLCM